VELKALSSQPVRVVQLRAGQVKVGFDVQTDPDALVLAELVALFLLVVKAQLIGQARAAAALDRHPQEMGLAVVLLLHDVRDAVSCLVSNGYHNDQLLSLQRYDNFGLRVMGAEL